MFQHFILEVVHFSGSIDRRCHFLTLCYKLKQMIDVYTERSVWENLQLLFIIRMNPLLKHYLYSRCVNNPIICLVYFRNRTRLSPCTSRRPLSSSSRPAPTSSNSSWSVPKTRATSNSARASVRCSNSVGLVTVSERFLYLGPLM